MPLGVDNKFIQIVLDDFGSLIAFSLNSNIYLESLSRLNYMGLENILHKS
jgi:hypothetical protein